MTAIFKNIFLNYRYLLVELADPRVEPLFLMGSPFPLLLIVGCYLYFIFSLGPRLMHNRSAFKLERLMIVYNLTQIVSCSYLFIQGLRYALFKYSLKCEPVDYSYEEIPLFIMKHFWFYFLLKVYDLMDTVFFVLRKKNNQVTFLHVYHHTGMCILGWIGVKYIPGGHGFYLGFVNCFVHIIMYFYYLLSAWNTEYKKNIWWKKYITQLQIVQFFILTISFGQILFYSDCAYPKWATLLILPQNLLMLSLFTNFYIKNYIKPQQKQETKNGKIA